MIPTSAADRYVQMLLGRNKAAAARVAVASPSFMAAQQKAQAEAQAQEAAQAATGQQGKQKPNTFAQSGQFATTEKEAYPKPDKPIAGTQPTAPPRWWGQGMAGMDTGPIGGQKPLTPEEQTRWIQQEEYKKRMQEAENQAFSSSGTDQAYEKRDAWRKQWAQENPYTGGPAVFRGI